MNTNNHRSKALAAGLAFGLAVLASACGSSDKDKQSDETKAAGDTAAYCDALAAAKTDIAGFASATGSPDLARFSDIVAEINHIAAKAPANIASTWKQLSEPLSAMNEALEAANTNLTAVMGSATSGKLPEGVSAEQMSALGQQLATLQDPKIAAAGKAIGVNAKDVCKVDLSKAS